MLKEGDFIFLLLLRPDLLNSRRTRETRLITAVRTVVKAWKPSSEHMNSIHVLVEKAGGDAVESTEVAEIVSDFLQSLRIS